MKASGNDKWFLIALSIMIVATLVLSGCGAAKNTKAGTSTTTVSSMPFPPIRTGDITAGPKVDVATQSVNPTGGVIAVSKPGDIMDGFVIDVPPNSYSAGTTFKVSSAPITGQTFGSDINPISPMIYVDNGGTYSNDMMYIRVPVNVPAGYFAMGFIYDASTKQLEGMPLISSDSSSITVGTRHFSDFFISVISKTLLNKDIDSGFRPGIDDWQFTNRGSYISPGGHCEGQSLSALWYYCTRPDGTNARLFGRYDNNGNQPVTPGFWYDDSFGYRFASVIQEDIDGSSFANNLWESLSGKTAQQDKNGNWQWVNGPGIGDEATWDLFAYSILTTKEPQLVCIEDNAGSGHAMVCYEISADGNLLVADPNYPGNTERIIKYTNGKFQPYNSGANADDIANGNGQAFENIQYFAKSTVLSWNQIAQHWGELKGGTIGDNQFPAYMLEYKNDQGNWVDLVDGLQTPYDSIAIKAISLANVNTGLQVFIDGKASQFDANSNHDLLPGDNKLGIEILGQVNVTDKDGNPVAKWKYIDFQYVNVTYNAVTTGPQNMTQVGQMTHSNQPEGAFGTPDNPYSVTLSGQLKGDPALQFEGVEYYQQYGAQSDVMAFVWSIPKSVAASSTSATAASLIRKLGADGLSISFSNPKQTKIVRTDTSSGGSSTTTITWLGWGDGTAMTTGSNYSWSNGGSITRDMIAQLDTTRSGEGENSIMATSSSTIIQLTAKIRVQVHSVDQTGQVSDSDNTMTGPETVVIRLVQR